jgi:hypothetical protein
MGEIGQLDWSSGIVQSVARRLLPGNAAWDIQDCLLDDDGYAYQRGPVAKLSASATSTALGAVWEAGFVSGRRTLLAPSAGGNYVLNGTTPLQLDQMLIAPGPALDHYLAAPGAQLGDVLWRVRTLDTTHQVEGYAGSLKTVAAGYARAGAVALTKDSPIVTDAGAAFLANVDSGMFVNTGGTQQYVVKSVDSNTQVTLTEPFAEATTAVGGATFTSLATLDPGIILNPSCVATVGDRLCVAAERRLYIGPTRDPVSGRIRWATGFDVDSYHEFPGVITALAALRDRLFVFTTAGTYVVSGIALEIVDAYGNPQQRVELVSGDLIVRSAGSWCAWREHLVVAAADGVYLIDAQGGLERLSTAITPIWRAHVLAGHTSGMLGAFRDHVFVPIGTEVLVGRLDRRIETPAGKSAPWTRLTQGDMAAITAITTADPNGSPKLIASSSASGWVLDCSSVFQTSATAAATTDAVSSATVTGIIDTRDYAPAQGAQATIRDVVLDYWSGNGTVTVQWARDGGSLTTCATAPAANLATQAPRVVAVGGSGRFVSFRLTLAGKGAQLRGLTLRFRERGLRR